MWAKEARREEIEVVTEGRKITDRTTYPVVVWAKEQKKRKNSSTYPSLQTTFNW